MPYDPVDEGDRVGGENPAGVEDNSASVLCADM